MKKLLYTGIILTALIACLSNAYAKPNQPLTYVITETGSAKFFGNTGEIEQPGDGDQFYGQDASYHRNAAAKYQDNGDGTVSDLNTGLMWQKTPDFYDKMTFEEALVYARGAELGGYYDWRLPSIKELMSIARFDGNIKTKTPYIDTDFFDFRYPDTSTGARIIDAQYLSGTEYTGTVMHNDEAVFGFNFADGHIKAYPKYNGPKGAPYFYVRLVRGNPEYGQNKFVDNGDGTVSDLATGLMWQQADDSTPRNWEEALRYADELDLAKHHDWRLPNAKELQSIVDYTRDNPANNPVFWQYDSDGWYWTGTSYLDRSDLAIYIAFGKAVNNDGHDTHGAGAMRGDIKSGDPDKYTQGLGPQADQIRIYNYVRCVRDIQ